MRRTSVSLPTKQVAHDPYEKPDRYRRDQHNQEPASVFIRMQNAWMSQSQKARYLKTGAIVFAVLFLFYLFSPSGVEIPGAGTGKFSDKVVYTSPSAYNISLYQVLKTTTRVKYPPTRPMAPTDAQDPSPRRSPSCNMFP